MICVACQHERSKKFGRDRKGQQRYRCLDCKATWTEQGPRPLGDMRLPKERAVMVLKLLLDGMSIRAISRIVGISRQTTLDLLVLVGTRAQYYWQQHMRNLPAEEVECDEVWGYVACHERVSRRRGYGPETGDCYAFTAVERNSKLLLAYHLGKRCGHDAHEFMRKVATATSGRVQLTTDGLKYYTDAVFEAFRLDVDFAQLIKIYGKRPGGESDERRYSPAEITRIRKRPRIGSPKEDRISTSIIERHNLSVRMAVRRMTRLTNGYSKKWENHEAMLALYFLWYNYCRPHMTLKTSPAVKAGIADHVWSLEELLDVLAIGW